MLARLRSRKARSHKVRSFGLGSCFGFVLPMAFSLVGALLSAQTSSTPSSGSPASIAPKPTIPRPLQGPSNSAKQHSGRTGQVNPAKSSVKPSPGRLAQSSGANLSTVGPGGYSNVLQPFLGSANWVANPFLPSVPSANIRPPWAGHHRNDDILVMPVYIPYAPGMYDGDEENPGAAEQDAQYSDASMYDQGAPEDASEPMAPEVPQDPVVVQPATVLVFKDGHRTDVVNYAIVGDTLFDFADGATRKFPLGTIDVAATQRANEEAGVEFKLPPANR